MASGKWKPLHVAITSPFIWPWVRRGSERLLHDLSRYLIARGHRVTVFATGPHDLVEDRDGIPYHVLKQRWPLWPRQFNCLHDFAFRLQAPLRRCAADVVFSMSYFDAYAAIRARARTASPVRSYSTRRASFLGAIFAPCRWMRGCSEPCGVKRTPSSP